MFVIHRTPNTLRLLQNGIAVPVSESYLEFLCREAGVTPLSGEVAVLPTGLALDAIEEALGRISQDIDSAQALKKSLLRHFLASEAPISKSA